MKRAAADSSHVLIITGCIVIAVLAGFILAPAITKPKIDSSQSLPSYSFNGTKVVSDIPKHLVPAVHTFLAYTVKRSVLPKELTIALTQKGDGKNGNAYIGNWNTDGIFMTVLVTLTADNTHINYQRVWTMKNAEQLSIPTANAALSAFASPEAMNLVGTITCSTAHLTDAKTVTDCGGMKTTPQGDLIGITVRSPVELAMPPGASPAEGADIPSFTITSACFVPKAGTPLYTAPLCI